MESSAEESDFSWVEDMVGPPPRPNLQILPSALAPVFVPAAQTPPSVNAASEVMPEVSDKLKKVRAWVFTVNNYTELDIAKLQELGRHPRTKYMIFSEEVAPCTGMRHLQGYIQYKSPKVYTSVRKDFPCSSTAWLSWAKASPMVNRKYVMKTRSIDETPNEAVYEFGEPPKGGKEQQAEERERYSTACESAKAGLFDDIDPDLYVRYYSTWKRMFDDHIIARDLPTLDGELQNEWIYGPAGTGKSRSARERYPNAYLKLCNKWWDGYKGEEVVIIEDYDKRHDGLAHHMKIWGDRFPFLAEVKGSALKIRPLKIIVTSNYAPSQIWTSDADLAPLERRYKLILMDHITTPAVCPAVMQRTESGYAESFVPPEQE